MMNRKLSLTLALAVTMTATSPALAQTPPQAQHVKFSDCSGGGFGVVVGAGFALCRKLTYVTATGIQVERDLQPGGRAKLAFLEGQAGDILAANNREESYIECVIPNFDPSAGFNSLMGHIGAELGAAGPGGGIRASKEPLRRAGAERRVSCKYNWKGGGVGFNVNLGLSFLRLPAQKN